MGKQKKNRAFDVLFSSIKEHYLKDEILLEEKISLRKKERNKKMNKNDKAKD